MGSYYIKVEDSPDVRRKLLESSKAGLHILHSYQELKIVRNEKLSMMLHLRQQMKELNLLLNRVETLMPELTDAEAKELMVQPLPKPVEFIAPVRKEKPVNTSSKNVFIKAPKQTVTSKVEVKVPELEPVQKVVEKSKPLTELEKLQKALEEVESKLDRL